MRVLGAILCGGKGARLGDVGEFVLKPLIRFEGRPFVKYIIDQFNKLRVDQRVVVFPSGDDTLQDFLKGMAYVESRDSIPRSIRALESLTFDAAIICYGDTIADIDLEELLKFHISHEADLTVTTFCVTSNFGIVECFEDDIEVKFFEEKPILPMRINIGYMVINKDALKYFDADTLAIAFERVIADGKMCAYHHTGLHFTYNTTDDARELKRNQTFINLLWRIKSGRW